MGEVPLYSNSLSPVWQALLENAMRLVDNAAVDRRDRVAIHPVSSEGRRERWGTPTMARHICG